MLEAWEDPFDQVELFLYSDFPFNMEFIERDAVPTVATAENIENIINTVVKLAPENKVPNWVVSIKNQHFVSGKINIAK